MFTLKWSFRHYKAHTSKFNKPSYTFNRKFVSKKILKEFPNATESHCASTFINSSSF